MKDKEKSKHPSNSDVQIEVEAEAIQLLSKELNDRVQFAKDIQGDGFKNK